MFQALPFAGFVLKIWGFGSGVLGLGMGDWGLGVWGSDLRDWVRVEGLKFGVQDFRFGAQG